MPSLTSKLIRLGFRLARIQARYRTNHPPYPKMRRWNYGEAEVRRRYGVKFARFPHVNGSYVLYSSPKKANRVILYFPGGAYSLGPFGAHYETLKNICDAVGGTGILLDYPKTPEFNHRDIRNFLETLWPILRDRFNTETFEFIGDSAGGGLAIAAAFFLGESISPRTVIAISPWVDLELSDPRTDEFAARDPYLAPPGIRAFGKWYAAGESLRDPFLSPLYAAETHPNLRIEIYSGTDDVLHPGALDFVAKREKSKGTVTLHEFPGMMHAWALMPMPEGRQAIERITATLLR